MSNKTYNWEDDKINQYLSARKDLLQLDRIDPEYKYKEQIVQDLRNQIDVAFISNEVERRNSFILNKIVFFASHLADIIKLDIGEDDLPQAWQFNIHNYIGQRLLIDINEDTIMYRFDDQSLKPNQAIDSLDNLSENSNNVDQRNLMNYLKSKREFLIKTPPANFIELEDFLRDFTSEVADLEKIIKVVNVEEE